jgi:hypothetical protein
MQRLALINGAEQAQRFGARYHGMSVDLLAWGRKGTAVRTVPIILTVVCYLDASAVTVLQRKVKSPMDAKKWHQENR